MWEKFKTPRLDPVSKPSILHKNDFLNFSVNMCLGFFLLVYNSNGIWSENWFWNFFFIVNVAYNLMDASNRNSFHVLSNLLEILK